jgi:predicted amidohydrolase
MTMKLAAVQFKPRKGDGPAALAALAALVEQAAEQGAGLVVCPEMATSGYLFQDVAAVWSQTEAACGPGFQRLSAIARRYACYIVCGYAERSQEHALDGPGLLYNSARLIGPSGELLCNYRKRLLFPADTTWAVPGNLPYPLVPTPLGSLTAGICMDLNDDRFTAFLRRAQARVIAFCTNWVDEALDVRPYWRSRLAGVRSYFVAANTYGWEHEAGVPAVEFCGASTILGPDGTTLARAEKIGDAVILAELPPPG